MAAGLRHKRRIGNLRALTTDSQLNRAFQLAHSIHRYRPESRGVALEIVREAATAIDVRLKAQDEADRHDPLNPSKVRWGLFQWFQLLIYIKSDRYEKLQEKSKLSSLTEDDMIVRYLKHLVLIACRRNSFHVSLALTRLLYAYNTPEAIRIYNLLFQDPDSSTKKADAYYRDRKKKLMNELQGRFDGFIEILPGPRGENMFKTQNGFPGLIELVIHQLCLFAPWETDCKLPRVIDPWIPIPALRVDQVNQIHAVIHPQCFSAITAALKLDPPATRLSIPRFFAVGDPGTGDHLDNKDGSSSLTDAEAEGIRKTLAEQNNLRKKLALDQLSVVVDGIERARVDSARSVRIRLGVPETALLVEIIGHGNNRNVTLAAQVLTCEDEQGAEAPRGYSIALEGGRRLTMSITRDRSPHAQPSGFALDIKFQETSPARAGSVLGRWLKELLLKGPLQGLTRNPAFVLGLIAICLGGLIAYTVLRSRRPSQLVAQTQPSSTPEANQSPLPASPSPQAVPGPNAVPSPPGGKVNPAGIAPAQRSPRIPDRTREQTESAAHSLRDVHQIYVETLGDDPFGQALRRHIILKLAQSGRFTTTDDQSLADAAVSRSNHVASRNNVNATVGGARGGYAHLQLLNIRGEDLLPQRIYRGTPEQAAAHFVEDLLKEMGKAGARRDPNK
jgi:hypothetical protein